MHYYVVFLYNRGYIKLCTQRKYRGRWRAVKLLINSVVKRRGVWYFVESISICLKLYFLESRK